MTVKLAWSNRCTPFIRQHGNFGMIPCTEIHGFVYTRVFRECCRTILDNIRSISLVKSSLGIRKMKQFEECTKFYTSFNIIGPLLALKFDV